MTTEEPAKAKSKKKSQMSKLDMPKKLKKLASRFVKFDGKLAQAWLDNDQKVRESKKSSNRKLTASNVKAKVDHMLNDSFMTTSQGITVDWDTAVIDGQHTLNAIVNYYKASDNPTPITVYVTEGEDPSHFPFYDQGKTRSNEDVFGMSNVDNPREHSVAARLLWIRVTGKRISGAGKMSPYALVEFSKEYKGLAESLNYVLKFGREENEEDRGDFCKSVMTEGYAAALHYLMVNAEGSNQKLADEFFDLLINPEKKSPLAPCVLRRKLNQVKNNPDVKMNRDSLVDHTIEAFNRFLDKKTGAFKINKDDRPQLGGYDGSQSPVVED